MAKGLAAVLAFNRGLISRLGLSRVDLKRSAFSAEIQTNFIARVLGAMALRPGWGFLGAAPSKPKMIPFIFSTDDTALLEITNVSMRVWSDDVLVHRPQVSTTVTNSAFTADIVDWTDSDEAGGVSAWKTGGYMSLIGDGTAAAIREQQLVVAAASQNVEHALQIIIARGPVTIRVGTTAGGEEYIRETDLATGSHSLAFTPTGDFYIRLFSRLEREVLVNSVTIESAGAMMVPAPWSTDDLPRLRWDQSGDVVFVACKGFRQRRIERRASRSWSIVEYLPEDGPFLTENVGPITLAASGLTGNITVTASKALFRSTHVGALYRLTSGGQRVTKNVTAANQFSSEIRVTGVGEQRRFTIERSGVWVATVTLQRSIGVTGLWEDVESYTTNDVVTYADELDNQIVYYRIGVKLAAYTSGTAVLTLSYTLGSITGVVRVTGFTSSVIVDAEVLSALGGTDATDIWSEGLWSDFRGWPTAFALAEGRLWWVGKNAIIGSISDAFDAFDPDFVGAAGPINRTIGSGPVDDIQWLIGARRLLLGAEGAEMSIRSSALDEPISPTNFNIKEVSSQGSAVTPAVKVDTRVIFVQRSGVRLYELGYTSEFAEYDISDLTALVPDIGSPGIDVIAVQRQPDTRIHCVRSDGTVALAVIDRAEKVLSWQEIETDGEVIDVAVLPGTEEDDIYYVVERSIGSSGVTSLSVTAAGAGYNEIPDVTFSGGGGSGASATLTMKATAVSIGTGFAGAGYTAGDVVTALNGTSTSPVTVTVNTVDGSGAALTVSVTSVGNYSVLPENNVSVSGGTGTGLQLVLAWGISTATVFATGGSYESIPTVTVTGTGTGAQIIAGITTNATTAYYLEKWAKESECQGGTTNKQVDAHVVYSGQATTVSGGFVSSLSVVSGVGYDTPPALAFSGGGGSGAAATISLTYVDPAFGGISFFSANSGYSKGDVISPVGGTYTRPARIQIRNVVGNGIAVAFAIIDGGSYSVVPAANGAAMAVTGGTGHGIILQAGWGLGEASISSPGTGYTSAPLVTLSAGPGPSGFNAAGSVSAAITQTTSASDAATTTLTGLEHLEGSEVVVWGDGVDLSPDDEDGVQRTYTVSGGRIELDLPVSRAVVGLPFTAQWQSSKLAHIVEDGQVTALNQRKRVTHLGLVLANAHYNGLKFGPDFDTLDSLPGTELESTVSSTTVWETYDFDLLEFNGTYNTDARVCLQAQAPRPVTVLSAVVSMESHLKS